MYGWGKFFTYSVWVYLFNDCMVFATCVLISYRFSCMFMLNEVNIVDLPDTDAFKNVFQVQSATHGTYTFLASSPEEKASWLKAIMSQVGATLHSARAKEYYKKRLSSRQDESVLKERDSQDKGKEDEQKQANERECEKERDANSSKKTHASTFPGEETDSNYTLQMIIKASLQPPAFHNNSKAHKELQIELKERIGSRKTKPQHTQHARDEGYGYGTGSDEKGEESEDIHTTTPPQPTPALLVKGISIPRLSLPAKASTPPPRPARSPRSLDSSQTSLSTNTLHLPSPTPPPTPSSSTPNTPVNKMLPQFFTRRVRGLYDEELEPEEEEAGVFCLSFYEKEKLYDLGVVKQKPNNNAQREEKMRKEVNREYQYIAKGIRERQRKLFEARPLTHTSKAQSREVNSRKTQLEQVRSLVNIHASQQKLEGELFHAGPTLLSPRTSFNLSVSPGREKDQSVSPQTGSPTTLQTKMFSPVLDEMKSPNPPVGVPGTQVVTTPQHYMDKSRGKQKSLVPKRLSSKTINKETEAPNFEQQHLLASSRAANPVRVNSTAAQDDVELYPQRNCGCCIII